MLEPTWLDETEAEAWQNLLAVVHRAFPEIDRDLQTHGLLGVHYHIFAKLSGAPDHTMGLSELAEGANLSQSRLTHRMRTLVERGEVAINQCPEDGRAKLATLTPIGKKRLAEIAPHHVATVRRVIFDHLSPAETAALAKTLRPIAQSVNTHPEYLNPKS